MIVRRFGLPRTSSCPQQSVSPAGRGRIPRVGQSVGLLRQAGREPEKHSFLSENRGGTNRLLLGSVVFPWFSCGRGSGATDGSRRSSGNIVCKAARNASACNFLSLRYSVRPCALYLLRLAPVTVR